MAMKKKAKKVVKNVGFVVLALVILSAIVYVTGVIIGEFPNPLKDDVVPEPEPGDVIVFTLSNGGFEQGSTGWAVRHGFNIVSDVFHGGTHSLKSSGTYYSSTEDPNKGDARASWTNSIAVSPGQRVVASAWIKTESSSCVDGLRIGMDFKDSSGSPVKVVDGEFVKWGNDWTYREISGVAPAGTVRINLWLQTRPYACPESGWYDDINLEVIEPAE